MALALARRVAPPEVTLACAAVEPQPPDPLLATVMAEAGLDGADAPCLALDQRPAREFDVVVVLSLLPAELPLLPGHPAVVQWAIPDAESLPSEPAARRQALADARDLLARLVGDFFAHGYLQAFLGQRRNESLILDGVSDGIMAHDLDQRVVYLNQAAESITGIRREQALGRPCHEVFGGSFCGPHCLREEVLTFDERRQRVKFVTPAGERRVLDTRIRPLQDRRTGRRVGVVVSFRDQTREQQLEAQIGETQSFGGIIGRDPKMQAVYALVKDVADTHVPVMIQGESGTGKELVAAAIHNESPWADRLFVTVNCGALPEGLLESELFGHVKGSFTGAIRDKKGRFEMADGGTIFLDEVGDVTPAMQMRLLRVLQEGEIQRVGSETPIHVSVRIISATNKDLRKELESGRFREDLYYRLNVVPIFLPPLRERAADIPLLADYLLKRFLKQMGREQPARISPEAMDAMLSHTWPGNVRELQNWIQFALVKCRESEIRAVHLPLHLVGDAPGTRLRVTEGAAGPNGEAVAGFPPPGMHRALTVERVREALVRTGGSRIEAARALGVSRATLYRFFAAHGEPV